MATMKVCSIILIDIDGVHIFDRWCSTSRFLQILQCAVLCSNGN